MRIFRVSLLAAFLFSGNTVVAQNLSSPADLFLHELGAPVSGYYLCRLQNSFEMRIRTQSGSLDEARFFSEYCVPVSFQEFQTTRDQEIMQRLFQDRRRSSN